jgi:hypothetical protein
MTVRSENVSVATYLADRATSQYAHCNNFFDWFCSDKALVRKQESLDAKVRKIAKSKKIDVDKMYVWYKNNCPVVGGLYDDIRFADLDTGLVIFNVIPKNPRNGKSEVYDASNGFRDPVVSGTWKDVLAFFS